jgi:hypothetical protein
MTKHRQRVETDIANQLMKELRILRRNVSTDWEVGFDEIGALQRISLRHILQIQEVREKSRAKRAADDEADRVNYANQQHRQMMQRQAREVAQLENEEKRARRHILECEEQVDNAIFGVFKEHRKKLLDTEGHIMALLLRQQQKMQQFENEKEKLKTEEASRREGNINAEKRGLETIMQLEPELRKRALQLTAQRLKKDATTRQNMLDSAASEKLDLHREEEAAREDLTQQRALDANRAAHRTERRLLNQRRCVWREGVEAKVMEQMLAEDHHAWQVLRAEFERTMVFTAVAEEAAARLALANQKQNEKLFIWGLLRARQVVFQNEHRLRSEIIEERRQYLEEFEEQLRISQDQSMFVWLETIRRRTVEEEWRDTQSEFVQYQPIIVAAAVATYKFPRTKSDRPVQSTSSDMSLNLHSNTVQWLFLSEGCSLLEFSSLRIGGTTTVTDLKGCAVTVELMNPIAGDVVYFDDEGADRYGKKNEDSAVLFTSTMAGSNLFRTSYSGHPSGLLSGIKYRNTLSWSKFRVCPRVIKVRIEGMTLVLYVIPQMPLCSPPDVLLCTRVAMPFANFVVPSASDYKSFRCTLSLSDESVAQGHSLSFVLPSEFFNHPKNGIVLNGKQQMKLLQSTPSLIEFEMDPKSQNLRQLLNSVKLNHGDDVTPCAPLSLQASLLRRSDAVVVRVRQAIDIDRCDVDSPRLRASSLEIPIHAMCTSTSDRNMSYVPKIQQNIFHNCFITFPDMMVDVVGGNLHFELGEHDKLATMEFNPSSEFEFRLHPRDMSRIIDKTSALALTIDREAKVEGMVDYGTILGQGSPSMIIKLHQEQTYSTEFINNLLQSVAIQSNRRSSPSSTGTASPATPLSPIKASRVSPMQLSVRINVSLHDDPILVTFSIVPGPAVMESSSKQGGFPYKEGSGAKAFPTMQLKPWPLIGTKIGPEAVLHVKIVDGAEETDYIELGDTHERFVNGHDRLLHMQAGQVVAAVQRLSSSEIIVRVCGELAEDAPWMRKCIEDPYKYSLVASDLLGNYDISAQHVNVLLRSLRYKCTGVDPQVEEKKILVVFDNGRSGRSAIIFNLTIETVDDPTDIVFSKTQLDYRQMSRAVNSGFGIMPDVRLEDVDSDNFHGGYIVVDHISPGPGEVGDSLTILSHVQQEAIIHGSKGLKFTSYLNTLLSHAQDPWQLTALSTVSDEAPERLLTVRDGKLLIYAGQQIGTLSMKYSGRDKDTVVVKQLRFNFYSDDKFVSFPAAEYCMRCVGFENLNPKMVSGPRVYQITLNCTGLASTADTVEKLTIVGYNAILSYPASAPNVVYEEGGKSRPLLKLVNASVATNIFQKGYFQATILNPSEGDEIQLEPNNDVKIRDMKLITVGKETFGNMPPRKAMSTLRVDFLKVSGIALLTLCKCITFSSTNTKTMDPTQRLVEISCTPNGELELCTFVVCVDIVKKEVAAEVQFAEKVVPYQSGSEPAPFLRGVTVIAADRFFPIGTTAEVTLADKAKSGESLVTKSSPDCKFVVKEGSSPMYVSVVLNGVEAALISQQPRQSENEDLSASHSGTFWFTNAIHIGCMTELEGWELAMILECICYANSSRSDACVKKSVSVSFRLRSLVLVRATVLVEIAPPLADFSACPSILQGGDTKGGLIAPVVRMSLVSSARDVVVTASMLSGFDYTDILKLDVAEADLNGLSIEGDMVFFTAEERYDAVASVGAAAAAASPEKQRSKSVVKTSRQSLGTITSSPTTVSLTVENLNNAAVQSFLRSVMVQGEPCSHKSILIEVVVTCSYGHCRQTFRMLM